MTIDFDHLDQLTLDEKREAAEYLIRQLESVEPVLSSAQIAELDRRREGLASSTSIGTHAEVFLRLKSRFR